MVPITFATSLALTRLSGTAFANNVMILRLSVSLRFLGKKKRILTVSWSMPKKTPSLRGIIRDFLEFT